MKTTNIFRNCRGFTLIEIAIVLVIIGLLVGMGANMIGPLTQRAKLHETKEIINAATEAIISYGASNNAIPDIATFPAVVRKSTDVWNNSLYYILDDNLTDNTIGGICGRKSTNLELDICPDSGCLSPTNTVSNVAFIILSSGANLNNQTEGNLSVTSLTNRNTYNQGIDLDDYTTDMNRSEPYDDIVKWISLDELRVKAGCSGAQLKIVNNELPYGYQGSTYNATIFADGGVPFSSGGTYNWCRQQSAVSGLTFAPLTLSTDCLGEDESDWTQANNLIVSGTPTSTGSFSITFFVRDDNDEAADNDNIVQKTMVLTVNPQPTAAGGCADYRVWNTGGNNDFRADSLSAPCSTIASGNEVTTSLTLNAGETTYRYNTPNGTCGGGTPGSLSYNQAVTADADGNCCVGFNGSVATERNCS